MNLKVETMDNKNELTNILVDLQNKDTEFYIWSAYWRSIEIYEKYKDKINIVGFLDSNPDKEGAIFSSLPIFLPKILEEKNPKTTKVIMAYHSSYSVVDELKSYGFSKNIDWFDYKNFDVVYNYSINKKIESNHVFFSFQDDNNISNRISETIKYLSFDKVSEQVDNYFNCVDKVDFFGVLDEDWVYYSDFKTFLDYLYNKKYFAKIGKFFVFANNTTEISDEYLELFSKYGVVLRLSNYKEIGCNTEPLLPLISRLDTYGIEYYLMFAPQEGGKRKYVPGEKVPMYKPYSFSVNNYDYPNNDIKNATIQCFMSTCDGDIRTILKNNKLYLQKTLDLCTYLPEINFEELDSFDLNERLDKLDLVGFFIGNKNKKRPARNFKMCFTGHGLGNQLFHYIFKRYMEEQTNETLIFEDTKFLYQPEHNGSELRSILPNAKLHFLSDYFPELIFKQISLVEKNQGMFLSLLQNQNEDILSLSEELRMFIASSISDNDKIYPKYRYYPEIIEHKYPFIYYGGFWFNENWLTQQKSVDIILKELEFEPLTDKKQIDYLEQIKSTESIAVHVRRGDALNVEGFLATSDFFQASIKKYRDYINTTHNTKPTFFVFSDDLEWCKENTVEIGFEETDDIIFVENCEAHRDIQLMSLCQHMIICRSTFSFFASLLNRNKTYIKPFSFETYDYFKDTIDLEMLPNGIYK